MGGESAARRVQASDATSVAPERVELPLDRRVARTARTVKPVEDRPRSFTAGQRLFILEAWMKSRLPATDFAPLVGVSQHTLYGWKQRFESKGPAALEDRPRGGPRGSRLPEPTRRAILMLKEAHPDWGQDRIQDVLIRSQGFAASPGAIQRVLEEEGYVVERAPTSPHEPPARRFDTAPAPNLLWQTDLFTFLLKRENRRVHLVSFLDDHSRFVVGYGLHATASGAMVREVFEAAVANFGAPRRVLTDNGTQYKVWRGKSAFTRLLERRGIEHTVAAPRHPATLGKVERFWGTLWREFLERAIFQGIEDARRRIGWFIDHYNFQRTHSALGHGVVPADLYFAAAPEVKATLLARVARNAEDLARNGVPRKPFYFTGRVGDEPFSLHAEGDKVVLMKGGEREEVDLSAPGRRTEEGESVVAPEPVTPTARVSDAAEELDEETEEPPPGTSPLDAVIEEPERGGEDEEGGVPCAR
jgi:transposase InsO family protein